MQCSGTIYLNGSRYWLKVRLPGANSITYHPLKPAGSRYATKDRTAAVLLAEQIWRQVLTARPGTFDGRLASLVASYVTWARSYYLPPSHQAEDVRRAVERFASEFPDLMAEDVNPLHLKRWREVLIAQGILCRRSINEHVSFVQRMFRWAASEMMVPVHVHTSLCTLDGLRQGRTAARESKKVLPVPLEAVQAVLGRVSEVVADAIRVQLLTGMRPGEVLRLRPCDIDRTASVWIYRPAVHKTAYLGHSRFVVIGPKAQAVLNRYIDNRPAEDYCFKPAESAEQGLMKRRLARKTPLNQGNRAGTNKKGTAAYSACFDVTAYRKAIQRACRAAGITQWHPHQLRHTAATVITSQCGLDAARAVPGHRSVNVTNEYAVLDLDKAAQVARMLG